ncbi:carboxymuconolactone decarboxylase family protein [Thermodesulfobacteriota bacterium]
MPWTPWIEIEPDDTADETARRLYHDTRNPDTGRPTDLVRLSSLTPEVAELMQRLNHAIHNQAGGLSVREQEIAALIVSAFNGCVH